MVSKLSGAPRLAAPPRRDVSGGHHPFFNPDASRHCPLVFARPSRRVLQGDAGGVKQADLVVRGAASLAAGNDFADLAGNVALFDQAGAQRDVYLSVVAALADIVDEDARPLQDLGVELLVAALVGAEGGE